MKYFIKKTQEYTPKNKLQKAIIDALKDFDCTLVENRADAEKLISKQFHETVEAYIKSGGKALLPHYTKTRHTQTTGIFIEDTIIFSLYPVLNELGHDELSADDPGLLVNILQ